MGQPEAGRRRLHPSSSPRATVTGGHARGMALRGTVTRGQGSKGEAELGGDMKTALGFKCGSCNGVALLAPV